VALVSSLVGGVGAGAIVSAARATSDRAPAGFELLLGALVGIFVFQWALHATGFQLLALTVVAALGLGAVLPGQTRSVPVASPAPG
jgi:hypothetical protein